MPAVCNVGSVDSGHGGFSAGTVVTGDALFTVNAIPISKSNDISVIHIKPDNPPHAGVLIGSSLLTVNGVSVALVGDPLSCGAVVVSGQNLFTIDKG
ncbi:PAAR domain-containing protein [Vibrio fluvialis]|uniref:PAAR domain-containing protein n=1 Tax=Vibrio fluvialis TaxID=676 RepID=UPI001EECAD23|nr:PAAR domain-containing protein [Vibrio fluvialis]MCG6387506.1 PAAR domain-containing protein [Vibrio fluvialis]